MPSPVDGDRLARYADKLDHAERRLGQAEGWLGQAADDEQVRLAAYKAFQEAVEALTDVAAMLVADLDRVPKDDYTNLAVLVDEGVLAEDLADRLAEANGLRNRLVHEYNGLDDDRALRSAGGLVDALAEATEVIRAWLSQTS